VSSILPTHTCFDDAIEIMEAIVKVDPSICFGNDLLLVHAVGLKADGKRFSHAWLEMDGMAIFRGIVDGKRMELSAPRRQYYHSLKLQQLTRYNCRQVRDENIKSGHFGPWIEPYISLCRDPDKNPTYQKKNEQTTMPLPCGQNSAPGTAHDARTHQATATG
jgi:hypothetical protein